MQLQILWLNVPFLLNLHSFLFRIALPHSKVIHDLAEFKQRADLIVCNRKCSLLHDVQNKVYTRDVFGMDD